MKPPMQSPMKLIRPKGAASPMVEFILDDQYAGRNALRPRQIINPSLKTRLHRGGGCASWKMAVQHQREGKAKHVT